MTYEEVIKSGHPFNRPKYKDGWYYLDHRGLVCHTIDLSIRCPEFTEKDKLANDWIINKKIKKK